MVFFTLIRSYFRSVRFLPLFREIRNKLFLGFGFYMSYLYGRVYSFLSGGSANFEEFQNLNSPSKVFLNIISFDYKGFFVMGVHKLALLLHIPVFITFFIIFIIFIIFIVKVIKWIKNLILTILNTGKSYYKDQHGIDVKTLPEVQEILLLQKKVAIKKPKATQNRNGKDTM